MSSIGDSKLAFESLLAPGSKASLRAMAPTDIWRKPPNLDVFDAPVITKSIPISSFKRVRVSASGEWSTLYDQGGLVLVLPPKKSGTQKRWIKTGIEFYNNKPRMSVVAADEWADWSLLPLSAEDERAGKMTVEMEREQEDGEWNSVLRVSLVDEKGNKMPIREVTWAFHDLDEGDEMMVGVYAAKPTKDAREELPVKFEGFAIEYRE
jgi:regulation of enolase protein 1 (concanavalin A-like superfamily)